MMIIGTIGYFGLKFWFLLGAIFVAGFIDSIAGGGGLISLPSYLLCGLPAASVLGTNKFVSSVGTAVSTSKYVMNRKMPWLLICTGLPFSLAGAALGARNISVLPQDTVRRIVLFLLPLVAVLVLLPKPKFKANLRPLALHTKRIWLLTPLVSFGLGWYDGFFGPGTGTLLVLALSGIIHLEFLQAAAAARFFNLCSNIGALTVFVLSGKVIYALGLPLAVASIGGHYCGSHFAIKRGAGVVRVMLIVSSTLLLATLAFQELG